MEDSEPVKAAMASLQLVEGGADPGHGQGAGGGQPGEGPDDPEEKWGDAAVAELSSFDRLPMEIVQHIMSFLSPIEQLGVQRVSRRWQGAVSVSLGRCRVLDTKMIPDQFLKSALEILLPRMPGLRGIWRSDGPSYHPRKKADLALVCDNCRHLVKMDLGDFSSSSSSLSELVLRCPGLVEVRLRVAATIRRTDELKILLPNLANLRSLEIPDQERGNALSLLPSSLERLIIFRGKHLASSNLRYVGRCSLLRELKLRRIGRVQVADLAVVVTACPQLEYLSIDRSTLNSEHMRELTRWSSLLELDVSRSCYVKEADVAAVVAACPRLERLTMREMNSDLKPERFLPPLGAPHIRHLDISANQGTTDETLYSLSYLVPGLQTLIMRGTSENRKVTKTGLRNLNLLPKLDTLDIGSVSCVTNDALMSLRDCQLRELRLKPYNRRCTAKGVTRFVLCSPSLKILRLTQGSGTVFDDGLDDLVNQLPPDRDFTLLIPRWSMKTLKRQRQESVVKVVDIDLASDTEVDSDDPYDRMLADHWMAL